MKRNITPAIPPVLKIGLTELRNTKTVAIKKMEKQSLTAKIQNEHRDIYIEITYFPDRIVRQHVLPYWLIEMREEDYCKSIKIPSQEIDKVRDIFNGFVSQSANESYLENAVLD